MTAPRTVLGRSTSGQRRKRLYWSTFGAQNGVIAPRVSLDAIRSVAADCVAEGFDDDQAVTDANEPPTLRQPPGSVSGVTGISSSRRSMRVSPSSHKRSSTPSRSSNSAHEKSSSGVDVHPKTTVESTRAVRTDRNWRR